MKKNLWLVFFCYVESGLLLLVVGPEVPFVLPFIKYFTYKKKKKN